MRPAHRAAPLRLLIVGNGLDAWFTAAELARLNLSHRVELSVVSDDHHESGPYDDFTLPDPDLTDLLSDPSDATVGKIQASFMLGSALSAWTAAGQTEFHPLVSAGASLGPVSFPQLIQRLRQLGENLNPNNYSLAALAAQTGRFMRPTDGDQTVLSTLGWGLQLDRRALRDHCKRIAIASIAFYDSPLQDLKIDENGTAPIARLATGECLSADLIFDCTGNDRRVVERIGADRWCDWSKWFPYDQIAVAAAQPQSPRPAFVDVRAHSSGWSRHLVTLGSGLLSCYYARDQLDNEAIQQLLLTTYGLNQLDQFQSHALASGRLRKPWSANCVALGDAAATVVPLGISRLQLLRRAVARIKTLLPVEHTCCIEAAEFNRQTEAELDHARDYSLAHHYLSPRRSEGFWTSLKEVAMPDSLAYKLEQYRSHGRVPLYDHEPLEGASWISLFEQMGCVSDYCNVIAAGLPRQLVIGHLDKVRKRMLDAVRQMPSHEGYLNQLAAQKGIN